MTNRRQLIAAAGAAAAVGALTPRVFASETRRRVIVIGAGILGVSIAYHLTALGADVVVLEKERGPGQGCTQGAFAMLIPDRPEGPAHLSALYGLAVLEWRKLQAEARIPVQWGGMLNWARPGAETDALLANARAARAMGGEAIEVDFASFSRLAPGVRPGPMGGALFRPHYGVVNPMVAVEALSREAVGGGAQFRYGCTVRTLRMDDEGHVVGVATDNGELTADAYVIAAGAGSPALAEDARSRLPIHLVSGVLAHTRPHRRVLSRVLNGPGGSIKQDPDGRFVTGLDYRPDAHVVDTSSEYGERLLSEAAQVLPAMRGARLEHMTVGHVPIPADFTPIVGFCASNLYVLVTMSGITMAPLLGRIAASEIQEGVSAALLSPCRPDRFG